MQTQAQYSNAAELLAGLAQRIDIVDSFMNGTLKHNTWTVEVASASDAVYTITVTRHDGTAVVITYNEGAAGSTTSKATGLKNAINASVSLSPYVVATSNAAVVTITSLLPGERIVVTESDSKINSPSETVLKSSSASLPFGFGLVRDSGNVAKLPAGAGEFIGVVMRMQTIEQDGSATTSFGAQNAVPVLARGDIYVEVDEAVSAGDAVYLRHTGTAADLGKFRNDADTANAQLISGAKFLSSTTGAGLALVRLS